MLAAVIEAQVNGGFDHNAFALRNGSTMECVGPFVLFERDGEPQGSVHLIGLLLDGQGLRAAYGEGKSHSQARSFEHGQAGEYRLIEAPHANRMAAHRILDAWLSKPEGDVEAAIRTAYGLLTNSREGVLS